MAFISSSLFSNSFTKSSTFVSSVSEISFSSSSTLSKINADDRAMVYAELVKQYDKISS